jgi:hypothetical protein
MPTAIQTLRQQLIENAHDLSAYLIESLRKHKQINNKVLSEATAKAYYVVCLDRVLNETKKTITL